MSNSVLSVEEKGKGPKELDMVNTELYFCGNLKGI
jgi:hypothetical protein